MTKQEKVDFAISKLDELYQTIPIPLDHKDPYGPEVWELSGKVHPIWKWQNLPFLVLSFLFNFESY